MVSVRRSAAALLALALAGMAWAFWGFDAYYGAVTRAVPTTQTKAQTVPDRMEEGRYLARVGNCIFATLPPAGRRWQAGGPSKRRLARCTPATSPPTRPTAWGAGAGTILAGPAPGHAPGRQAAGAGFSLHQLHPYQPQ